MSESYLKYRFFVGLFVIINGSKHVHTHGQSDRAFAR